MQKFEELKDIIAAVEADVTKFTNGNAAAGTRVRKAMQELKTKAQDIRAEVISIKDGRDNPEPW